jgi:hypothetical protein
MKMIGPLRHRAENRFKRDLVVLLADLRETATADQLAEAVLARVQRDLHASRGSLMVDGAVKGAFGVTADEAADESLFPLRVPLAADYSDISGWLLVGPRADGRPWSRAALWALDAIVDPVTRALTIVTHRERLATEQHWLIHSLDMRLTQLEKLLAAKN